MSEVIGSWSPIYITDSDEDTTDPQATTDVSERTTHNYFADTHENERTFHNTHSCVKIEPVPSDETIPPAESEIFAAETAVTGGTWLPGSSGRSDVSGSELMPDMMWNMFTSWCGTMGVQAPDSWQQMQQSVIQTETNLQSGTLIEPFSNKLLTDVKPASVAAIPVPDRKPEALFAIKCESLDLPGTQTITQPTPDVLTISPTSPHMHQVTPVSLYTAIPASNIQTISSADISSDIPTTGTFHTTCNADTTSNIHTTSSDAYPNFYSHRMDCKQEADPMTISLSLLGDTKPEYSAQVVELTVSPSAGESSYHQASHREPSSVTLSCDICHRSYPDQSGLSKHQKTHLPFDPRTGQMKDYECEKCKTFYKTLANLNNHKKYHARDKENSERKRKATSVLQDGDKSAATSVTPTSHHSKARRASTSKFSCGICENDSRSKKHSDSHERINTKTGSKKKYHCVPCNMFFSNYAAMYVHRKKHSTAHGGKGQVVTTKLPNSCNNKTKRTYKCSRIWCEKSFHTRRQLIQHKRVHEWVDPESGDSKAFGCNVCWVYYDNYYNYKLHLNNVHGPPDNPALPSTTMYYNREARRSENKMPKCTDNKQNKLRSDQRMIQKVDRVKNIRDRQHSGTLCTLCDIFFIRITQHSLIHQQVDENTGEVKTFSCAPCKAFFSSTSALTNHRLYCKKHDRNFGQMYQCGECNFSYRGKHAYNSHLQIHDPINQQTGEGKPHTCDICPSYFQSAVAFAGHNMKHKKHDNVSTT